MNWKFFTKNKISKTKVKKSKTREWVDAIIFAVVAATIIRGLLFSAYAIPSGSMEGTELTGDYLFVSKCSYGARIHTIHRAAYRHFNEHEILLGRHTMAIYAYTGLHPCKKRRYRRV